MVKNVTVSAIEKTESVYGVELGVTAAEQDIKEGDVMVSLVEKAIINACCTIQILQSGTFQKGYRVLRIIKDGFLVKEQNSVK